MFRVAIRVVGLIWLASCAMTSQVPPAARSDLAPTDTLRAAINFGNPILAARDASTGEPRGVSVDLSRELALVDAAEEGFGQRPQVFAHSPTSTTHALASVASSK